MPRRVIAQPLPQDLRNGSFRGMNCEGWDFEGRDIRGCDFRNAKLKGANFSQVIAGRSQKQIGIGLLIAFIVVGAFAGVGAFALTVIGTGTFASTFASAGTFAAAIAGAVAITGASAVAFAFTVTVAGIFASTFAITGTFTFAGVGAGLKAIEAFGKGQNPLGIGLSVLAIVCLGLARASARQAIRELKIITGTNFKGADLKGVDFSHATLNNCNFDNANTSHINWSHVEGARSTIDFNNTQLQLLISCKGTNGIYSGLDLSDRHLAGIDLIKANLSGADLTRSNLQHADLTFANLTNVKAGGTDLRYATLTGACIQNWTTNGDTQFDDLICEFIYITPDQDPQNRRPLAGSFEPGDFEKLVDKFADTLDFILRRGTDPIAFTQALNQFKQDNPEALIKAIVELDRDRVLVQATVPEGSNKVKIYETFQDTQIKLQAAQQENFYLQRTVDDKDKTISMMDRPLYAAQQRPINVLQQQADTIGATMPDNRTKYESGGDINIAKDKSAINTGTGAAAAGNISGNLNLNLAALRETEDPKDKELVDLITQLRTAIESPNCALDDRFKQRALQYLDNLASLAKDQPEDLLKSAKDNLDDLADIADKGSKLASFAKDHFPTFTAAIAALRLWFGV